MAELLPHHRRLLESSGIAEHVRRARGYWSATEPKQLERYFGPTQRRLVPALVIPLFSVYGEVELVQIRPDEPRVVKGRVSKYELPSGRQLIVDIPPGTRPILGDQRLRCWSPRAVGRPTAL